MVFYFNYTLEQSKVNINFTNYHKFNIHNKLRTWKNSCDIIEIYGKAKWDIIDILNEHYNKNYNLENWINNIYEEVSFFLNEAGSNSLNHTKNKTPLKFHLFLGKLGFIIGIEQECIFNPKYIQKNNIKTNEGRGFKFYKICKNKIFFDNPTKAKIIFMEETF